MLETEFVQTPPTWPTPAGQPRLACSYEALEPGASVFELNILVMSPATPTQREAIAGASALAGSPDYIYMDYGESWIATVGMLASTTTAVGSVMAAVDDVGCTAALRGSHAPAVQELAIEMAENCQAWVEADEFAYVPSPAPVDLPALVPDADPLADQNWSIADVSVFPGPAYTDVVSARLTNADSRFRAGAFSLGIFVDGQLIWQGRGPASAGAGGDTVVHFFGVDFEVPGDPSTYTYAFRTEGTT